MTHQQLSSITVDGLDQTVAEHLHGAVKMPEPEGSLGHLQHGCSVQGGRAVSRLL